MEAIFQTVLIPQILMAFACVAFGYFFLKLLQDLKAQRPNWKVLVSILLAGLLVRIAWICYSHPLPQSDFQVYWDFANQFYRSDFHYTEITRHPGVIMLYTLAFYLLGPSLVTGWLVNLFLSLLLMILVYAVTRQAFEEKVAIVAMAFAAFLPQLITYSALFASEIPAVTFALLFLWVVLYFRRNQDLGWGHWASLGVLLYGMVLIRSTYLLYLGVLPVVFWLFQRTHFRAYLRRYAVMVLTAGVLLSSWSYHQYLLTGSFKLFWGSECWLSNIVEYKGKGHYVPTFQLSFISKAQPHFAAGTVKEKAEGLKVLQAESLKIIRRDPMRYLLTGFSRIKDILWTSQTGIRWSERGSETLQALPGKVVKKLCTFSNVVWQILFCLSPLGFLTYRSRKRDLSREVFITLGLFLGGWILFHYLLAIGSERYGFQVIPFVLVLAAGGVEWLLTDAIPRLGAFLKFKKPGEQHVPI